MAQLRIGCVVMAAGNARRFGENKLAVQVQGKALFHRALEAVPAEQFVRTVVVSQYPEVLELAHRMGFVPVPNRHPDWGISHTIRKQFEETGEFRDVRAPGSPLTEVSTEDKIRQLEHQVNYLTQEMEFLKKISSIRSTRK